MNACHCTGACRRLGRCPNAGTWVPWRQPYPPQPWPYPRPAPPPTPAPQPIVIQPALDEETIRRIVREELERAKGEA